MTSEDNPWKELLMPKEAAVINSRRIDPDMPWNIFWAIDWQSSYLLIFRHDPSNRPEGALPKLRGLRIETYCPAEKEHEILILKLIDKEQHTLFYHLCKDILSAVEGARSERDAIGRFLGRIWCWYRLLQKGRLGRLSDEEQKGLIGELAVLQDILLPVIGFRQAVSGWTGPLGTPKDFEVGTVAIECKARSGAAKPQVKISSEHQLESKGVDSLFLHVVEITQATSPSTESKTVADLAKSISDDLGKHDLQALDLFETRLLATGFDWTHDYSDSRWLIGAQRLFKVERDFPRITPNSYPLGVSHVYYSISLTDCERFRVNLDELKNILTRKE